MQSDFHYSKHRYRALERERERERRGREIGGVNELLLSLSGPASPDVDGHTSKERREGRREQ